jgi:AraC-like DNA-binding protein
MLGSVTSVLGESDDFHEALRADGIQGLLITGPGTFRARLTQITLHDLRLLAGAEHVSRIAFVVIPADKLLVSFAIDDRPAPIWGAMGMNVGELVTITAGQRVHTRTNGPSYWGAIRLSVENLIQYGFALSGAKLVIPPVARWRPGRMALKQLRRLHQAAVHRAKVRSEVFADAEAAHGLEQQVIHALVDCFAGPIEAETEADHWHCGILARFEDLIAADPLLGVAEISTTLGITHRVLSVCCKNHLGMGPHRYLRLQRMQLVRRALLSESPDAVNLSKVVRRYGWHDLDQFTANYRTFYGKTPSDTLRHGSPRGPRR